MPAPDACGHLPFFNVYEQARALRRGDGATLVLDVDIDLHGADCGAPDGYGHDMELTLWLEPREGRCEILAADASASGWGFWGEALPPTWVNTFAVQGKPNLGDKELARIELRDEAKQQALVLLPENYYFFEDVPRGAALHPRLMGEEDTGCCYGYTSADSERWSTEFWLAPLWDSPSELSPVDLGAFNRWATGSGLREDLPRLLQRGFKLSSKARVSIDERPPERATEAAVIIVDAHPWDETVDARQLVLHFSRKECATCASGMSGWWLYRFEATQRCKPGQGHEEWAEGRCG
jgi:hypothetical protein